MQYAVAATWAFSKEGVASAAAHLDGGASARDAIVEGVATVEDDVETGPHFVGRGSPLNSAGEVELDAAIMDGASMSAGCVAAVRGFATPIRIARDVMEKTRHTLLVGGGAIDFARRHHHKEEDLERESREPVVKHSTGTDTVGMVCVTSAGGCCAGCSTSGPDGKMRGRVGDGPILGSGLYADADGGACVATGDGDISMQYCPSFAVVKMMEEKRGAEEACESVMKSVVKKWRAQPENRDKPLFDLSLLAISAALDCGGATITTTKTVMDGEEWEGFPFSYQSNKEKEVTVGRIASMSI